MNTLLQRALEAHGGLQIWRQFTDLVADVEVTGSLCSAKGWTGMVPQCRLLMSLTAQRMIALLPRGQGNLLIQADEIRYTNRHGMHTALLRDVQEAQTFDHSSPTAGVMEAAYVMGYAIRHAVTSPFLYTLPGFAVEEVTPWYEEGEAWRVLKITFPRTFGSAGRVQFAYYGDDGLLRRTRSQTRLIPGIDLVEYTRKYQRVNGILLPARREVFPCDPAGHTIGHEHIGKFDYTGIVLTS